jgi:hypothetical protein
VPAPFRHPPSDTETPRTGGVSPSSSGVGAFRDIKPAADVFDEIVRSAEAVLGRGVFAR